MGIARRHSWLAAAGVLVGCLLFAPGAMADTYCVEPATGCDSAHTKTTISAALSAATDNPGADTVELGATTYSESDLYYGGAGALTIHGAGAAATTIQQQPAYDYPAVLTFDSAARVDVSDLRIHLSSGDGVWAGGSGGGTLDHLVIDGGSDGLSIGVWFRPGAGWALSHSTVDVATQEMCVVNRATATSLVDDALRTCDGGVESDAGSLHAQRLWISGTWLAVFVRGGDVRLDDSLIDGDDGVAVQPADSASLVVNHSTLVGSPGYTGARCSNSSHFAGNLTLTDSIVLGYENDISRSDLAGFGSCDITADYNDYDASSVLEVGDGTGSLTSTHVLDDVDPQFVDAAAGNYRLAAGSPLLNRDPRQLDLAESPTDLDGIPRIADGARDLGAYERPAMSAITTTATEITQTGARLGGSVNSGGLPATWRFLYGTSTAYGSTTADAAVMGSTVTATLAGLTPATTYHYKLVLTTPYGNVSGLDDTFTTSPQVAPHGPPVNRSAPSVVGSPTPEVRLTCTPGRWTGAESFAYEWLRDGVRHATGSSYLVTAADVGHRLSCRVTATNPDGSARATSPPVQVVDRAPPRLTQLKVSPARFRALKLGPSIITDPNTRGGTLITFRLDERATVTFTVQRAQPGRLVGGRCQRQTKANRTAKPCTLWVKVSGSFKITAKQGANTLRFSGRLNGRALAPGSHRLTAIARDSAGNLAKPVRATFTIRR